MKIYFTVCNSAYLSKAIALGESLKTTSNGQLIIYLFEEKIIDLTNLIPNNITIRLAKDLDFDRFYELAFKYDVTEFTTSLKPFIALNLFESFEEVIFLDPDTYVLNDLSIISELLHDNDILLTPHYLTPHNKKITADPDLEMMRFGCYNLGFFAVKKSEESINFLKWLNDRCIDQCFFETQFGLSTDQKWVSIASCFFDRIGIIRNPGFNVAFWNLFERKLSTVNNVYYINDSFKLYFFHFSSFNTLFPSKITRRQNLDDCFVSDELKCLADLYKSKCARYEELLSNVDRKYSYGFFSNGVGISVPLRRAFANKLQYFVSSKNIFSSSSNVYIFAKINYLIRKADVSLEPAGFKDIKTNKLKFIAIFFLMKIILNLLGPNKFNDFSRLLVYLSSYRRLDDLWKVKS
jgi:hypothetical protein